MIDSINETHNPNLRSWVESANAPGTDFPIQNLPFGVFRRLGGDQSPRVGVAIGDCILDLAGCQGEGLFNNLTNTTAEACATPSLNALIALGHEQRSTLRRRVSDLLSVNNPEIQNNKGLVERLLVPIAQSAMLLPAEIGDYTDFYASVYHATNVGGMFRPDNPLLPNYKYVPIAYHSRASSVVVSGTPIRRPCGQTTDQDAEKPTFGPSRMLDYELEVGFFVGPGNPLGEPICISDAERHIFGLCLVNDWSARDIQRWEYQPLGPFLAKSFATTISPWVVTMEALAPFRVPAFQRPAGDPAPLPYLNDPDDRERGGVDLTLEVLIRSSPMREQVLALSRSGGSDSRGSGGVEPMRLSRSNFRDMYWTVAQMLTHHASNGCNLRPGDLIATGTVSGAAKESRGCLLELTWCGSKPITLPTGEGRRFLQDGDEIIMRGACEREGFVRIGFGECAGIIYRTCSNGTESAVKGF